MFRRGVKSTSVLGWVGLALTVIYLLGIGYLQWNNLKLINELALNEFGDFLAGAFGPLAIFWLVLSFFQQGRELQNSVDALNMQARELEASVEQQKALVEITKDQLQLDMEARIREQRAISESRKPHFLVSAERRQVVAVGQVHQHLEILNTGAIAQSVTLSVIKINQSDFKLHNPTQAPLKSGQSYISVIDFKKDKDDFLKAELKVIATNSRGEKTEQNFRLNESGVELIQDFPLAKFMDDTDIK